MDIDEVSDELYGLPLGDFVAVRNARAKEAKAAGDRDLAAAITAMPKPTKAGWLTNQLVRRRRDEISPLLDLGAGLREATASLSGDQLRELNKQQGRLVYALVQQARAVAAELGESVTDDVAAAVDQTLRAALADEELAQQLAAARLIDKLELTGFGAFATAAPVSTPARSVRRLQVVPPKASGRQRQTDEDRKAEQRREAERQAAARRAAEQALEEARREASRAADELAEAQGAEDDAQQVVSESAERTKRLAAELEQAKADHAGAEQARTTAHARSEKAARAAHRAGRAVTDAEAELAALATRA